MKQILNCIYRDKVNMRNRCIGAIFNVWHSHNFISNAFIKLLRFVKNKKVNWGFLALLFGEISKRKKKFSAKGSSKKTLKKIYIKIHKTYCMIALKLYRGYELKYFIWTIGMCNDLKIKIIFF